MLRAHTCQLRTAREAVEHNTLGCTLGKQHAHHIVMRVTVVDHQRAAELLRQSDVPPERLFLCSTTVRTGAEMVETRLSNGTHPFVARQRCDLVERCVE
jgi:hypothetical protein